MHCKYLQPATLSMMRDAKNTTKREVDESTGCKVASQSFDGLGGDSCVPWMDVTCCKMSRSENQGNVFTHIFSPNILVTRICKLTGREMNYELL